MSIKKSKKVLRVLKQIKSQRGLARKRFFEEGGELAQWRGVHVVYRDKKKYDRKLKHRN